MKFNWRAALGIALSALLLWLTLRGVEFRDVWQVLRSSNLALFVLGTAVATCMFPLRAIRWQPILEPVAGRIPFAPLWRATAIGMMANNVLPLRAGEVARALALTRQVPRVALATSLSSLAVDRLFDAIIVFLLMFGAMLDPAFPADVRIKGLTIPQMATSGLVLMIILLVGCYTVVLQPERVQKLLSTVALRIMPRFEPALIRFFGHVAGGLAVLKDSRRFLVVLGWALAHWLVHALGLYICFVAVGVDVPFSAALFLQGILAIGVAVPSSPGFVGVFEGAATIGLAVYGVPTTLAVSWAIGYHVLSFIPITTMGAWYFVRLGLGMKELRGASANAQQPT
ncbi:MAG: flippase-like domain-containing protein [Phycisphaerae bacterium]|nr:flippase-like domain-containing protein [Gemmatimonadaceae bacterium]